MNLPDPHSEPTDSPAPAPNTDRNATGSPWKWPIIAGLVFAGIRFSIGAVFALMAETGRNDPSMRGVADLVWIMSATAAGTAGLIGVGGFWLLRHKLPTPAQGSLIGLTAALSSYVGIGLVAGILMTLQDDPERRTVVNAAIDSLFCGIGSALITGSTVLPALCIAGLVVAKLQRAAFSPNLNNMAP